MKKFLYSLVLILSFFVTPAFGDNQSVRVLILSDAKELKLAVHSTYEILDLNKNKKILSGKWLSQRNLKTDLRIHLGEYAFDTDRIIINSSKDGKIFVNGKYFRGELAILKKEKGFSVINILDIEDYLKGVLYHEVSPKWPLEVLKAQAIVARTFALYQNSVSKTKEYDLTSDTFSQVYGGLFSEESKTNLAVDLTKGKVLTYGNKLFPAYYHATCGGFTEDASVLWNIDIPPLKVVKCNFCNRSPHFVWDASISLREIEEKLSATGINTGNIIDIKILSFTPSGRINTLLIKSNKGESELSAKQLRQSLGGTIIRSTNFSLRIDKGKAIFKGIGWGHGVGMCQWGANFMAESGSKAGEILRFYYPKAEITDINQ
ncbi:MAG: SpoIID/LytB domain-containing protein [Candidatus Omnitrophica bacterium]|nr:SpoIID/LytB domain-containing protein [Candidatus Omnitrophota bacterium]